MPPQSEPAITQRDLQLARARARVLASEDRALRLELIRLRVESGLTQKQVAERMGVTQQAVYKLERYDADPKLSTLRRYANAVGALVEHKAVSDVGQSEWLAAGSPWDTSFELPRRTVRQGQATHQGSGSSWSATKRTDLALAS